MTGLKTGNFLGQIAQEQTDAVFIHNSLRRDIKVGDRRFSAVALLCHGFGDTSVTFTKICGIGIIGRSSCPSGFLGVGHHKWSCVSCDGCSVGTVVCGVQAGLQGAFVAAPSQRGDALIHAGAVGVSLSQGIQENRVLPKQDSATNPPVSFANQPSGHLQR
jgi:hypothetical protein